MIDLLGHSQKLNCSTKKNEEPHHVLLFLFYIVSLKLNYIRVTLNKSMWIYVKEIAINVKMLAKANII